MIKIICKEDCGNAPKKLLLKNLNIAFAKGDIDFILEKVAENIDWILIGNKRIEGKENFSNEFAKMKKSKSKELSIENIITHGNTGAVNGLVTKSDGKKFAFCHVYIFMSASAKSKIKKINTYCIEVP